MLSPTPLKEQYDNPVKKGLFSHIWQRWFNDIARILSSNANSTVTIVSSIQAGGGGGVGFQYKTRALTIADGVVTAIGDESAWNDI